MHFCDDDDDNDIRSSTSYNVVFDIRYGTNVTTDTNDNDNSIVMLMILGY